VEQLILDALKHRLMQPEAVRTFTAELHAEINRSHRDGEVERARLQREHERVKARLEGLYDAIAEGLRTEGLLQRIKGMEAEQERPAAALDRPARPAPGCSGRPFSPARCRGRAQASRAQIPTVPWTRRTQG
jgi:site-specific DNA recombinase